MRGTGSWRPHLAIGKQLMHLGLPASLEQVISSAGFMTMLFVVAKIGTDALAAQQIAFTALNIGYMPAFGFGIAVTALVGQSIGANRILDAGIAAKIGARLSVGILAVAAIVFFFLARPIMGIFTDEAEVISQGVSGLRALAISLPFWGAWFVYGGALRGTGDTVTPLVVEGNLGLDRGAAGFGGCALFRCRLGSGLGNVYHRLAARRTGKQPAILAATRERKVRGSRFGSAHNCPPLTYSVRNATHTVAVMALDALF